MTHPEYEYLNLLKKVLNEGIPSDDRTGNGTLSIFGAQMRFPIYPNFPLLTTKKVFWKGVVHELLWFLKGDTNIKYLVDNGVHIWDDDAYRWYCNQWAKVDSRFEPDSKEDWLEIVKSGDAFEFGPQFGNYIHGDLGPVYGAQWRGSWGEIFNDQIAEVIQSIKTNPYSRRHIVSAWNPEYLEEMALPPCHYSFQFYVRNGKLSCLMNQRSADVFLGLPFNIASYALLTYMIAQVCDLTPHELIISIGDAHIYNGHIDAVKQQLQREPKHWPTVTLDPTIMDIDDFKAEHIRLFDYKPHPTIKAPLFT